MDPPASDPPQFGNRPSNLAREYRRAYKACIRCRETKAKCEPSTDSDACIKCVRESRSCEFTAERSSKRRKIKTGPATHSAQLGNPSTRHTGALSPPRHGTPEQHQHRYAIHSNGAVSDRQNGEQAASYDNDVVQTVVSSSKDALGLLFKAAEQQETDSDEADLAAARAYDSPASAFTSNMHASMIPPSTLSKPVKSVIELWNQHRFVRQGWFSAVEAVTYVDLFFRNLSSLSPVSSSFYADHSNHRSLILDEPLLCCTILMISSRYHVLPGPGGSSRAEFIHMRLWKHCEHLIARITFGQEKYSTAKTRTLGSIKALLLMTEWHPRALHFPPDHDGWDASLAPSIDDNFGVDRYGNDHLHRWREDVFEPAKRSDRMSWMLLGLATTLAHELGVFEEPDPEDERQKLTLESRIRTQRMLFLYVNQLSLRIGCTSFLPQSLSLSSTPLMHEQADSSTQDRDSFISQFIEITKLRKTTTEMFFPSKSATRQIMNSGRYITLLEHFQPLVAQWFQKFNDTKFTTLPPSSKQMLFIDYSYVRMYINSIAIQAVVERAKSKGTLTILDHDFLKKDNRREYAFIQEVIDASRSVLATAVELADADLLRYCPVRIFISVTSASIFLLKAISLGSRQSELERSLTTLEKCIHALRYSTHDDMHLSSRYGMLLDRHVRKFKRNFRVRSDAAVRSASNLHAMKAVTTKASSEQYNLPQASPVTIENAHEEIGPKSGLDASQESTDLMAEMDDWLAQPFDPFPCSF